MWKDGKWYVWIFGDKIKPNKSPYPWCPGYKFTEEELFAASNAGLSKKAKNQSIPPVDK